MLDNIKSKLLLNKLFQLLESKIKLKIVRYNKKLQDKLNLTKDDFIYFKLIKDFNDKYNSHIKDVDILELNLDNLDIKNSGLSHLSKIKFNKLKELVLSNNNIGKIDKIIPSYFNFDNLVKLSFEQNHLRDLTILTKADFKQLKKLNLDHNALTDIKILPEIKLPKLESLILSGNTIKDLEPLSLMNLDNLRELILNRNMIKNIDPLEKVKIDNLEILDLCVNMIEDINVLEKLKFPNLKCIDLYFNKIKDISVLEKAKFENLEKLRLSENEIGNIDILERCNFKKLKELYLKETNKDSEISEISLFYNFQKLEILDLSYCNLSDIVNISENEPRSKHDNLIKLDLSSNQLEDVNFLTNLNLIELKELNLESNNISDISVLEEIKLPSLQKLYINNNQIDKEENSELINILKNRISDFKY